MFVEYLNDRQQAALLHLAHETMLADGILDAHERAYMNVLRNQMRPGIEAQPTPTSELGELFDRRPSRVALFLELTGMGYANERFDPHQSVLLKEIAGALSLSEDDVELVYSWVERQLNLYKDAQNMMMED